VLINLGDPCLKRQVINFRSCCILLVDSVESMMMHGLANLKLSNVLLIAMKTTAYRETVHFNLVPGLCIKENFCSFRESNGDSVMQPLTKSLRRITPTPNLVPLYHKGYRLSVLYCMSQAPTLTHLFICKTQHKSPVFIFSNYTYLLHGAEQFLRS
jgi:hypothetical protein